MDCTSFPIVYVPLMQPSCANEIITAPQHGPADPPAPRRAFARKPRRELMSGLLSISRITSLLRWRMGARRLLRLVVRVPLLPARLRGLLGVRVRLRLRLRLPLGVKRRLRLGVFRGLQGRRAWFLEGQLLRWWGLSCEKALHMCRRGIVRWVYSFMHNKHETV